MFADNHSANLISGFRACDINPFQPVEVFKKLPDSTCDSNDVKRRFSDVFVNMIKSLSGEVMSKKKLQEEEEEESYALLQEKELHSQT